jgi:hypothetical protein
MRKNDLIKMLQNLKGNPEIVLWNSIVGDYMPLENKLTDGFVFKMRQDAALRYYEYERRSDLKDFTYSLTTEEKQDMIKAYKENYKWEHSDFITNKDIKDKIYQSKKVIYLSPKPSGKTHWDRMGTIEY